MKYLFVFLLPLAICACSKNKGTTTPTPTKTQLLTSASWQYENGGIDQDRNGTIDISLESTGQTQSCQLDNTGTFRADGTGTADEGATKCTPTAPQTNSFTWAFASNETVLNLTGSAVFGQSGSFKVVTLSTTRLTLSKDSSFTVSGIPFSAVVIVNLKH